MYAEQIQVIENRVTSPIFLSSRLRLMKTHY